MGVCALTAVTNPAVRRRVRLVQALRGTRIARVSEIRDNPELSAAHVVQSGNVGFV